MWRRHEGQKWGRKREECKRGMRRERGREKERGLENRLLALGNKSGGIRK